VGAANQLLEVAGDRVAGEVAPRDREVGGRAPVEAAKLLDLGRAEPLRATPAAGQQRFEPLPLGATVGDELLDQGGPSR